LNFDNSQTILYLLPKQFINSKILQTVPYEQNERKQESVFSKRIKAGKRRTYFFDVKATRGNDYFLTITESRKRFEDDGYDRHKVFIYKEDFNKFAKALNETIDYVKTDLMPDFDFDAFNHEYPENGEIAAPTESYVNADVVVEQESVVENPTPIIDEIVATNHSDSVDKW